MPKSAKTLADFLTKNDHNPTLLLSDADLAKLTSLTVSFFQVNRHRGTLPLPYLRIGRAVRYRYGDVMTWLDSLPKTGPTGANGNVA
jgi:hypothetical protein